MFRRRLDRAQLPGERKPSMTCPSLAHPFAVSQAPTYNPQPPDLSFQLPANRKQVSASATCTKQSSYFFLPANKLRFFAPPRGRPRLLFRAPPLPTIYPPANRHATAHSRDRFCNKTKPRLNFHS